MIKIPFEISARTAKLIGRENFSNPEGAIIELVKNSYDADAKECIVIFDVVFNETPSELTIQEYKKFAAINDLVKTQYKLHARKYHIIQTQSQEKIESLKDFFFSYNSIYVIDNGHGMTSKVVEKQWMVIGTGNKEEEYTSDDGRIKTGAKGIGRFALDRLGHITEMWTMPKKSKDGCYWKMEWRQFEQSNISLKDVNAELERKPIDVKQKLKEDLSSYQRINKKISSQTFNHGTIIKISGLKDNWQESSLENVYKSLEALIPPKELAIPFKVTFYYLQDLKQFGEVETAFFNDYDYKVESEFDSKNLTVSISITRDELDLNKVKNSFAHIFKKSNPPYDLRTLTTKKFVVSKSIFELLKWEKNNSNALLLKSFGDFSFSFYYLKNTTSKDYPYKNYNQGERQKVLKKYGGIRIYRDSFRVRPYGDIGNDWLKLGERAAQSPAGAGQRIGDWRVGPNQIAGIVKISRIENPNLIDKSDRGALIENSAFNLLRKIVTDIINVFELDRSIIINKFFEDIREKDAKKREEQIRIEAEKLAEKIIEERNKVENKVYGNKPDLFRAGREKKEKESFQKLIEEGFQKFEKTEIDQAEIAQVRMLASLGLIVSSFAHELKEVKNNADDIHDLAKIYKDLVVPENKKLIEYKDGLNIIDSLIVDNKKIAHWVEYSLTAIKKDKRKRLSLKFDSFFISLINQWKKVLSDRNITIHFKSDISKPYLFRAFEMDMSTIFSNLISNSIDSFGNLKSIREREIKITLSLVRSNIEILYSDNGIGIPRIFKKNREDIFLPFTTSKKDKDGNDIGTGLGMYLVKNVVNDNNGQIEIVDASPGFKMKIKFPIQNK